MAVFATLVTGSDGSTTKVAHRARSPAGPIAPNFWHVGAAQISS